MADEADAAWQHAFGLFLATSEVAGSFYWSLNPEVRCRDSKSWLCQFHTPVESKVTAVFGSLCDSLRTQAGFSTSGGGRHLTSI